MKVIKVLEGDAFDVDAFMEKAVNPKAMHEKKYIIGDKKLKEKIDLLIPLMNKARAKKKVAKLKENQDLE